MAAELGQGWEATCRGAVRGALDALKPEDPLNLSTLDVSADYAHSLDTDQQEGGTVGVAIQAITLNLNATHDRHETNTGNLHVSASFVRKEPAPALPAPEKPANG
jgi:hypothetical protein